MQDDTDLRGKVEATLPSFLTRQVDRDVFALRSSAHLNASETQDCS